jgi:hypothetical protein
MASIADVFTRLISPQTTDLYWDALKDLPIEVVERAVRSCIRHHKHFPKPGDIRERSKEMQQAEHKPPPQLGPAGPKWLRRVNGLFLQYLLRRRTAELFQGDINLASRRAECLRLAQFFEELEGEGDPAATEQEIALRFELAMDRVPDGLERAA